MIKLVDFGEDHLDILERLSKLLNHQSDVIINGDIIIEYNQDKPKKRHKI